LDGSRRGSDEQTGRKEEWKNIESTINEENAEEKRWKISRVGEREGGVRQGGLSG
jgi:hypothetical protein